MSPALFTAEELAPTIDREALSQWFTPAPLARRMAAWVGFDALRATPRILEPSAGRGALIKAICVFAGAPHITAHELDPRHATYLREVYGQHNTRIVEGDYLAAPAPAELYDLALMNPPYEGGLDGRFLEKAMDESERVIALIRLVALSGQERYRRVWSRVGEGLEFGMEGLAILSARPDFGGEGQAKSDFAVVKLMRGHGGPAQKTLVEWW